MGSSFSTSDRSSLKLQAQSVTPFGGGYDDWNVWKSRTECAFNGSGYEKVLTESEYSEKNSCKNKIVYSQLSVATVDGTAYHLVRNFDDTKDGHAAWKALCEWYDGEEIRTEAAENARSKLEALALHEGGNASDFVNKFLNYFRYLEKIPGEQYSKSHAVQKFLGSIKDRNYAGTVSYCRNGSLTLDACVSKVRLNERELSRKKRSERTLRGVIRRMETSRKRGSDSESEDDIAPARKVRRTQDYEGGSNVVLETKPSGRISVKSEKWRNLKDEVKTFVKDFNAAVNHNEDTNKVSVPPKVTVQKLRRVRRTVKEDDEVKKPEGSAKSTKKKRITFNLEGDDDENE